MLTDKPNKRQRKIIEDIHEMALRLVAGIHHDAGCGGEKACRWPALHSQREEAAGGLYKHSAYDTAISASVGAQQSFGIIREREGYEVNANVIPMPGVAAHR